MYKHYIRLNENQEIIKAFSDAFEQPLETDILYLDTKGKKIKEPRHTHLCCSELFPITNDEGKCKNKWIDGKLKNI